MNCICNTIEMGGNFTKALNLEKTKALTEGIKCSEELMGQSKEEH